MNLIVELLADSAASIGVTVAVMKVRQALKNRSKVAPKDHTGSIPWSYRRGGDDRMGFYCYKCINISKNRTQMPFCTCDEYYNGHFHFKCGDCGYTAIMRTADES